MKKLFVFLFSLILSVVFSTSASAYDVKIDGIYYNLNSEDKTAEVTSEDDYYSGDVVIPSSITVEGKEYTVTSIGDEAFCGCYRLTSITIPNSVTSIGDCAFEGCSGLEDILIIVNNMFVHLPETYSGHYSIPENISQIIGGAFNNCKGLTSVTIPNSVTYIGEYAFYDCSGLTSVTIPNSVTSIGDCAFAYCSGLTSVTIPNSVTSLGHSAFYDCSSLTSVTIPNSVTSIDDLTFCGCSSLTSVTIPNSVTYIGDYAFSGCSKLENVYCYAEKVPSTDYAFGGSYIYIESSTLHVPGSALSSYKATAPWSEFGTIKALDDTPANINTAKTRGVVIQSAGGFITLSGLDTNERVDFFTVDGAALGSATATDGTATFSATSGTIVVAKFGKESIKISVE